MHRTTALALALALVAPALARADASMECSVTAGSQVEIGDCVSAVAATVEANLEMALGFAMASAQELDSMTSAADSAAALESAQAAWLAYRDAHCDFVGTTYGGGSGTGIAINSCRIDLTRDRIESLMDYVQ